MTDQNQKPLYDPKPALRDVAIFGFLAAIAMALIPGAAWAAPHALLLSGMIAASYVGIVMSDVFRS